MHKYGVYRAKFRIKPRILCELNSVDIKSFIFYPSFAINHLNMAEIFVSRI